MDDMESLRGWFVWTKTEFIVYNESKISEVAKLLSYLATNGFGVSVQCGVPLMC